jgi:hypothetical protein
MLEGLILAAAVMVGPSAPLPVASTPDTSVAASSPLMTGLKAPYRGRYWRPSQRTFTLCVLRRESNGHWFSTNKSGGYRGAFQFNDALARGSTWMITPELQHLFGKKTGREIAARLRATPMNRWAPFYQHMAFATVLNWERDERGAKHWAGGRFACSL